MNPMFKAVAWPLSLTAVLCLFWFPWEIFAMVLVAVLVGVVLVVIADYLL